MSEQTHKAVYFFCGDLKKDPVAAHVLKAVQAQIPLEESQVIIDNQPVLSWEDDTGNQFQFVQTDEVLSHDYRRYLPMLNEHFGNADVAGLVNWHEGANAPERILCLHTTGDVPSGQFGLAHPRFMRNLMLAMDTAKCEVGLEDYTVTSEATHWSGIPYGGAPEQLCGYAVPLMDIEIGSSPQDWANPLAATVLARSLVRVFSVATTNVRSLLCLGGIHFEPSFVAAVLPTCQDYPMAVSHILPNHWLVAGGYDAPDGLDKLLACAQSIIGGVDAVVFHDNLKGAFKAQARAVAERLQVPAFKHQALRRPQDLPLW